MMNLLILDDFNDATHLLVLTLNDFSSFQHLYHILTIKIVWLIKIGKVLSNFNEQLK